MTTVLDLFCGCGGMSWGLAKHEFQILAGVDHDARALKTFQLNHPDALTIQGDIDTLDAPQLMDELGLEAGELDCLIGGPPCQGFSKNVPAAYRFLEDTRNQLFRDYLHFVAVFRPRVVVMENVAEIHNAYEGSVRYEIIDILLELGYQTAVKVLYAPDYGVPQRRRRCFFVASRDGVQPCFPQPTHAAEPTLFERAYVSAWEAISDLPSLQNGEGTEGVEYASPPVNAFQRLMREVEVPVYDHITRRLNDTQMARLQSLQPGEGIRNLPDHLRPRSGYSGAYGRLDETMLSPTITRWVFHPGSGRYGHPRDVRLITIREAARLQSFSDEFRFTGTYIQKAHQLGNAVPPLLMSALVPVIRDCLAPAPAVEWSDPVPTAGD